MRWCQEAQRFLQHHQAGIEQGYIHVLGAISFTPKESLIYKMYFGTFAQQIPVVLSGIPVNWPSHRILSGHRNSVLCVAFSPDGTRIVSGSWDKTLRLWNGVTGTSIGTPMIGHTRHVNGVAFSPDGTRIVSGSSDGTLRLWNGATGASICGPMDGHTNAVKCVAFSPDGARIISGSGDSTLRLWDGVTGARNGGARNEHASKVLQVAFSPDGTRVFSRSWDKVRLWDLSSCAEVAVIETIDIVHFSTCGSYLVSGSQVWDIRLLPPSIVKGANPVIAARPISPLRYDNKSCMIEVYRASVSRFPVSGCQVTVWAAHKGRIVLGLNDGRVVFIECTHLL